MPFSHWHLHQWHLHIDICTTANTTVGKTADTLAKIKAVIPNYTWSHGIHHHAFKVFKRKRRFTKECLWWSSYFTKSQSYVFLMLQVMKQEAHMSTPTEHFRKSTCVTELWAEPTTWKNDWPKQWLFQLGFLINIFSRKNESLSFQGKQRTVFIANNKIQAFKQKLELHKTFIHHCESNGFLRVFWWGWWWY